MSLSRLLPDGKYLIRISHWNSEHFEAIAIFKNKKCFYYDRKPGNWSIKPKLFFEIIGDNYSEIIDFFNDQEWLLGNTTTYDDKGEEIPIKIIPDPYPFHDDSGNCIETKTFFYGKWTKNRFCDRGDKHQMVWDFLYDNLIAPYFEYEDTPLPFIIEWMN
jgi:hypothetical protein